MLKVAFATGTEPGKWFRRFEEFSAHGAIETHGCDDPISLVLAGDVDLAIARVPHGSRDSRTHEDFHQVTLYEEAPGIAVPKDSVYAELGEELSDADIDTEIINYRFDGELDFTALRTGLQVVAANVGVVIAPRPVLKVLSKKLVIVLGYQDPEVPTTDIALVWLRDADSEIIQDFVGIARGRTAASSRTSAGASSRTSAGSGRDQTAGRRQKTGAARGRESAKDKSARGGARSGGAQGSAARSGASRSGGAQGSAARSGGARSGGARSGGAQGRGKRAAGSARANKRSRRGHQR